MISLFLLRQVANAAKVNASGVLIYPDPEDFDFDDASGDSPELFGHVSVKTLIVYEFYSHIEILRFTEISLHSSAARLIFFCLFVYF